MASFESAQARTRKRLCLLLPSHWEAQSGGAETQAKLLLERLLALDLFDLHYVARNIPEGLRPTGYAAHRIGRGARRWAGTFFLDTPALWETLTRLQPDLIYQRVGCAYTGVSAHYARTRRKRMVWHVAHDRDVTPQPWRWSRRAPLQKIDKAMLEYGVRHANGIIVQNQEQGRLLRQHYHRAFTEHIPNFHPGPTEPATRTETGLQVTWIANMKRWKHPELFIRLAQTLRHRTDVRCVMVGSPLADRSAMAALQAEIARTPNLQYAGARPAEWVNELLAQSHLLVNTSEQEGFSNTFIQAWLREVPVVSLNVNPDGVFDGDRHGVCATGSFDQLCEAVARLLDDQELRRRIGARSKAFAAEVFTTRNIDRVISVLDPSLAERSPPEQADGSEAASPVLHASP